MTTTTEDRASALRSSLDDAAKLIGSQRQTISELRDEVTKLRELWRVSFIQMLCILRQSGDKLEIYNSNATQIDPYSDEIIQTASDVHDSIFLERRPAKARAALSRTGE